MTSGSSGQRHGSAAEYLATGSSSFTEFLRRHSPELVPAGRPEHSAVLEVPHGTTIVSLKYAGGVLLAGDRRSTMGNLIAGREVEKVYAADEYSAVGIAGAAGLAIEMVRLFQVELEHYEKIEGTLLSVEGKANRLATKIRGNLGLAMQGLAVVPLFVGFDVVAGSGRIYSFDAVGGCTQERDHHSIGSGSLFARGSMKKLWHPAMPADDAIRVAVEALYDAADDDSATGGPDLVRRIFPTMALVDATGLTFVPEDQLAQVCTDVVADRAGNPGGAP